MGVTREAQSIVVEATITRADGTVKHLGTVAYHNKNPLKMIWWKIKRFVVIKLNFFRGH